MRRIFLLIIILLVSSCATTTTKRVEVDDTAIAREAESQKAYFVKKYLDDEDRLQNLTYRMGMMAEPLCGERVSGFAGLRFSNLYSWPREYRDSVKEVLGLDEEIMVTTVVHGSPAEDVDIRQRDIIVKIDGQQVGSGKNAPAQAGRILDKAQKSPAFPMTLRRDGQLLERTLHPVQACDSNLILSLRDEVNAYADGNNVIITRGLLRFAGTDEMLATVIAHEMAHNAMGHRDKKMKNFWLGSILDIAAAAYGIDTRGAFGSAAAQAFSQEFEAEADYVGLYIMNASGFPTDGVADFWRRMGAENPGSIKTSYMGTHPGTAERYLALERTSREIAHKTLLGMEVRPTEKGEEFVFDDSGATALASTTSEATFEEVQAGYNRGSYGDALRGYHTLAEKGDAAAAYQLAIMHRDGIGTDRDLSAAAPWMLEAAKHGYADARRDLPEIGHALIDESADTSPSGHFLLGESYWNGYGVDQDRTRGREFLETSAAGNYVPAQVRVAELYERGDGVLQSFDDSLRWYSRAALAGDGAALRKIGVMLGRGYGPSEHWPLAYAILNSLAANDDAEAAVLRDSLAKKMESNELSLGQRLSKEIHEGKLTALQSLTK